MGNMENYSLKGSSNLVLSKYSHPIDHPGRMVMLNGLLEV